MSFTEAFSALIALTICRSCLMSTPSVMVIAGEHDRLTVQSASQHIAKLLPNATTFCDHGGHLGHWEHSQSVNESILEFATRALETSSKNVIVPLPTRISTGNRT